ncbi:MAG TPA: tetratricopeptide repeat protein [Candidatus Udaeobacter sp.]|nr:tetratricopeptide repeat protein [Candidatus Udaeobacter sp.]
MSQGNTDDSHRLWWRGLLFALVLAALTIFAYRPAWNGGFLWDDDVYITNNELLTAPDGLRRIWFSLDSPSQYFPLVYTTFRIEHRLWGLNPTGYHWVNLMLHVANALLVWLVLARLKVPGAWLAGAIFALHPVQVESVAWITERKNVLMGFFFLLTLLAWIAFVDVRTKRSWLFYGLALILYVLALSAKTTACTLPAALFLILWLQGTRITWKRVLQIIPFLVLGIAMGLLAMWWERYHQGTSRAVFTFLSPIERILVASRAVWFYLSKLFWPSNLTFIYPRWDIAPTDLLNYMWLVAAVLACAAIYFLRRYLGRSAEVAAGFFVATLSPVLGFIMLYTFRYTFVADHYQYLACIGPIALVSAGLVNLGDRFKNGRTLIVSAGLCLVAVLGTLTWRQAAMYGDVDTLWRTTLAKNPACWMAHNNLGIALFGKGQLDEAIAHYRTTLQMQPDFWDADYNLGTALLAKGDVDEAIFYCEKAAKMQPNDPDTHVAFANALLQKKRIDDSIAHYQKAVAIRPDYFLARFGLSHALLEKGNFDAAIEHSRAALLIQPDNADCQTILAIALDEKGQSAEAIQHYEQVLKVSPQSVSALNNLAWLLAAGSNASLRNGARAIQFAEQANRLSGGTNALVLRTLAAAYAEAGDFGKAVETANAAIRAGQSQNDDSLATELQQQMELYELRLPYHEMVR